MLSDARIRRLVDYPISADVFPRSRTEGRRLLLPVGPRQPRRRAQSPPTSRTSRPRRHAPAARAWRGRVHPIQRGAVDPQEGRGGRDGHEPGALSLPAEQPLRPTGQCRASRSGFESTFQGPWQVGQAGPTDPTRTADRLRRPRRSRQLASDLIDKWKIFVGCAAPGTGNKDTYPHRIISTPFIGEPGVVSSETYLCIGPFDTKAEAESALSYLSCRLTRFLILLHKPSQHTTGKVYTFVPTQDWTRHWTDEDLYAKYGITEAEIAFIEKVVRPMELDEMTQTDRGAPPREARGAPPHLRIRDRRRCPRGTAEGRPDHQDVKKRVGQQSKTAAIKNYTIHIDEPAEREDGTSSLTTRCALASRPRASRTPSSSGWSARSSTSRR